MKTSPVGHACTPPCPDQHCTNDAQVASHGLASSADPCPWQSWARQVAVALVQEEETASADAASGWAASWQRARGAAARADARRRAVFFVLVRDKRNEKLRGSAGGSKFPQHVNLNSKSSKKNKRLANRARGISPLLLRHARLKRARASVQRAKLGSPRSAQ